MSASERLKESQRELTERMIEDMRKEGFGWIRKWRSAMPSNASTNAPYRGANALLLMRAITRFGLADPRFMTFNQAMRAGCPVKRGSHGLPIERWREFFVDVEGPTRRVRQPDPRDTAALARARADPLLRSVFKPVGAWTVFNVADLDGARERLPAPGGPMPPDGDALLDGLVAASPCAVAERPGDIAGYIPSQDRIVMPARWQFSCAADASRVLLHEECHATGAPCRLDRPLAPERDRAAYAFEELVAELGSLFCASTLGAELSADLGGELESDGYRSNHVAYLRSWSSEFADPAEALMRAASKASRASDLIIRRCRETGLCPHRAGAAPVRPVRNDRFRAVVAHPSPDQDLGLSAARR